MKRTILILGSLCLGVALSAQSGIISTRPANDQSGKVLTMEETIMSRTLSPENIYSSWNDRSELIIRKDGKWQTYDITSGALSEMARHAAPSVQAVTKGQSLYLIDREGNETPVAVSENSQITYGQYASRNEFGIDGGIFWAPDSSKVAFYRKDETKVTTFPLLDITTRTGSLKEIKYPMAGMDSENVQLGIYDLASGKTTYAKVDDFGYDQYLTNISWSPDGTKIFIQVLDRSQKHMKLNMYCAADGSFIRTILTEDNDRYIEPQNPIWFIKESDNLFIYRTDNRDGYRNLYLCDLDGNVCRLTATDADVEYIANDGKHVWFTSAEVSPIENHLFRVSVKVPKSAATKGISAVKIGKPERLTKAEGWHNIAMSPDCRYYTDSWSSLSVPGVTDLCTSDGKVIRNLLTAEDPTLDYAYTEISLGTVKSADGKYDNYYRLIKPKDFDPAKKYPVIVYVYGGPHSQMVQNTFLGLLRRWEMHMAQRGYLVYVQDNRGTSNRGAEFEKAIHGQCGQAEMADQIEGVKMLMELPYVDKDRIGVHGWSYGGFMTISLITNYPDIFKVGVAGGPVIDWKWYEVMYGERYMDHPERNPEGYAKTSLINKAKDLKGKLLICQGAIDPVVVWEHSLSFIRECIKNNVQVDYFPYPCAEHNVMGKDRVHLHDKITMYFEDYL
ncbi:MAG: DPP IV N-terminal domain-containing protein [Bacteroidales bacterium]|nr:DPP IV N-terminal domain-containing protein [Bacteroidales bacterium]